MIGVEIKVPNNINIFLKPLFTDLKHVSSFQALERLQVVHPRPLVDLMLLQKLSNGSVPTCKPWDPQDSWSVALRASTRQHGSGLTRSKSSLGRSTR